MGKGSDILVTQLQCHNRVTDMSLFAYFVTVNAE